MGSLRFTEIFKNHSKEERGKMKKKIVWLMVSCLMVLSLVLASCAPAAEPAPTTPVSPVTPVTPTPVSPAPTAPTSGEKPQYGGTINYYVRIAPNLDNYRVGGRDSLNLVYEKVLMGDWMADRNKFDFPDWIGVCPLKYMRGQLLESWEITDPLTAILHVRKGVKWQNKPPVNGRELTADDIIWNLNRYKASPFINTDYQKRIESLTQMDKYTILLKLTPPPQTDILGLVLDPADTFIEARESLGKSGEIDDWRNIVGTGPFMLQDYVIGSSMYFVRNLDYWGYDERNPQNKLPYADKVTILVIGDTSTQLAAMRTGKIDILNQLPIIDATSLLKTTPNLLWRETPADSSYTVFAMRTDTPPFTDVRVRQAMNMAIDRKAIIKSVFLDHADYYTPHLARISAYYTPYEKLPDKPQWTTVSAKDVVTYNPTKAKELLAQAGYPNGFKTNVVTDPARDKSGLSELLQYYLGQIGVQVEIKQYETSAFNVIRQGKTYTQIVLDWTNNKFTPFYQLARFADPDHIFNTARVNDPVFTSMYNTALGEFDDAKRSQMILDMDHYITEHAYRVMFPHPDEMMIWQPWLKGYAGEGAIGTSNYGPLFARIWVDQKLKESRGR